ncbi:MAG: Na+-dependent nucleoside transporter [Gammaproteobacteria bacterium]|nr:Na+-dependent nucleoside transporter [Gammaproteobacteria bacterium]
MYYLQIILGAIILTAIAVPLSNNYKAIKVKNIVAAMGAMVLFAFILLNPYVAGFFEVISAGVAKLSSATAEGTTFVFGSLFENNPFVFALNVLPLIIVMASISALLWHWRILPLVIKGFSYVCEKLFGLGGPISFGAAANIFVGQVEAPLFVRPYLSKMSKKELLILMTAGMATISGSIMIALSEVLVNQFEGINTVQHFLTASILSVPGAIMYAEIMYPSEEITHQIEDIKEEKIYSGSMDAITKGTKDGLSIAVNVAAILISVLALVSIVDGILGLLSTDLSLQKILGYIFTPISWLMGVPWSEVSGAAELLGIKIATNEFVAYIQLGSLDPALFSDRTKVIVLYALCGFANFSSVGILISGIGSMAPERIPDLIQVSGKALVGATLASCLTGLVAGLFV